MHKRYSFGAPSSLTHPHQILVKNLPQFRFGIGGEREEVICFPCETIPPIHVCFSELAPMPNQSSCVSPDLTHSAHELIQHFHEFHANFIASLHFFNIERI